ncbi:MAG: translation initiation factor IF-2 [Clostridiales bacterium]|nr:translation initiation factor IF-2 [Clostridiales bacterium]
MTETNTKETKIVKATPKKQDTKDNEPRVTVKAAVIPQRSAAQTKVLQQAAAQAKPQTAGKRQFIGTPVVNKDLENRTSRIPRGMTPVSKDVTDKAIEEKVQAEVKAEVKAAEVKAAEVKAEEPKAEEPKAEKKTAEKKPAEKKTAAKKPAEKKTAAKKAEKAAEPAKEEAVEVKAEAPKAEEPKAEPAEEVKAEPKKTTKKAAAAKEEKAPEVKAEEPKAEPVKETKAPKKPEFVGPKIIKKAAEVKAEEEAAALERKKKEEARKAENKKKAEKQEKTEKGDRRKDRKNSDQEKPRNKGQNKDRNADKDRDSDNRGQAKGADKKPRVRDFSVQANQSQRFTGKADKKGKGDKEHDKFSKLENGGKKSKKAMEMRSLEKAEKPKKHSKYKQQAVVEEEPDILEDMPTGTIAITVPITVGGFCEQADISMNAVIMALMKMGIMANINQNLDEDTVTILADELGISVVVAKVEEDDVEEGIEDFEDKEEDLVPRAPFVTVMGHVDHGKTSLLDAIRKTNVALGEAGGITQHIGASEVYINGEKIVFLDTPGHEAFTAMRARGAHVTDIAVLVVAADDGVMPQTVESISHAKAAGVPIIVAINKIDKPGANPDRVKQELTEHNILVEDWGGDTICVPVSAKTGEGITNLLEMILLQAEVLELKANPNRMAKGSVVEARLDKTRGPVATLLVDNGTLKSGQSVVVGNCYGRIRLMTDYRGKKISKAGPATAVEILGLDDVPVAGDEFNAVKDDKVAREIAESRRQKLREEILARNASSTLEQLFSQIQEGEVKDLNLIIKADVAGSVEAIVSSLEKLSNENVRVKVVHTGVGTINESDVMLASTTGSIIIGFNVRPTTAVTTYADSENVQIRLYRVIYDIINEIQDAMKGMLDPEFKEEVLGKVEVRTTFKVPNVGTIAGAYVQEGKVVRNAEVRLVRDGIVIHEGTISSLKRFKDDAKEVNQGYECGIGIENYNDIKEGDTIECFHMVEVERK